MMLDLWLAALLDASLKGLVLCLAAAAAALAMRRSSAAARHLVWRLAMAGLLALPVLAPLLPSWRVPLPAFKAAMPMPVRVEMAPSSPVLPAPSVSAASERTATVLPEPVPPNRVTTEPEARDWSVSWRAAAFGIWLAGFLAVLGSLAVALLRVVWRRRHAS
ncbi:MAG TPA: hypothetical protein VLX28_10350, partial [Thermoanaerobaculia bacterium]|nr:hypothetical protein [Thermoanaerobaculia bacterium]